MASVIFTAPTFPALEARLLADVASQAAAAPLAPQWIVVPSATLANHLRVRLANTATTTGALAGVRVISLPRLAERLTLALTGQPTRPWHPTLELLLFELVARLPARSPLANLKTISGGALLLRQAFTDLAEGGFGPGDLGKLADLAREPDLAPRERAVLELYAQWITRLADRDVAWAPLTLQTLPDQLAAATDAQLAAVLAAEAGQEPRVMFHGFYEWLDVHLHWLTALAERVATTIYYPWQGVGARPHPAFTFAASVLEDLRGRLGGLEEDLSTESSPTSPATFFRDTFPDGQPPAAPPAFLSWQRASGARAEAIAAAVRVRRWLDDPTAPIPPEDILVVAPQASDYVDALRDVFRAFAIPLRVSDVSAGLAPADQPLPMLARIWEEQAPAEWVLALLRAAPETPVAEEIDLDRFEAKVRAAGLWGGPAWRRAVRAECTAAEQRLLDEILLFVPADGAPPPALVTAAEARAVLERLATRWLPDARPLAPLLEATAPKMAGNGAALELRQWARLLAECAVDRTQRDPLTRAVLFTPLMRARGLTARAVVLLGLAAGQFPRRIEDDPVLSETATARIARVAAEIGHRLPLKSRATEEMLLLFHLINTAAAQIHWVIPETDASGKSVAPTPWVQRYLQRWETGPGELLTPRLPRSPALQARTLAALDPQTGRYLPPGLALALDPELAARGLPTDTDSAALESVEKRGRELAWSGAIGAAPAFRNQELGVTRIETLARCPFRFYAASVARWEPLEALSLTLSLSALDRGTLVHELLQRLIEPQRGRATIGAIAQAALANGGAELQRVAAAATAADTTVGQALSLLPAVFARAATLDALGLAQRYLEWAAADTATPVEVEQSFSRPFPGVAGLSIVGKIDRIDQAGVVLTLTDYKTGGLPGDYRRAVMLGWQIQATLYPWLCAREDATFQYIYLGRGEVKPGDTAGAPGAETLLAELAPVLTAGLFLPLSNQTVEELGVVNAHPCRYCGWASACRRFERGAPQRHAALAREHLPRRVESILAASQPLPRGRKAP